MKTRIAELVDSLVEEYDERDPFSLCRAMDIEVMMYDFSGNVKGYCFQHSNVHIIVINKNLDRFMKKFICAHELGHALMHEYYTKHIELAVYDVSARPELEANLFAAELLVSDEDVLGLLDVHDNYFDIAGELSVSPELLDFKIRMLRHKGYPLADFTLLRNALS